MLWSGSSVLEGSETKKTYLFIGKSFSYYSLEGLPSQDK